MRLVLTPIRADFRGHGQTDAGASMADWEVTDELWADQAAAAGVQRPVVAVRCEVKGNAI